MTGKQTDKKFYGTWYICEMEQWDADYFNMEVPDYIEIDKDNTGRFQFSSLLIAVSQPVIPGLLKQKFEYQCQMQEIVQLCLNCYRFITKYVDFAVC